MQDNRVERLGNVILRAGLDATDRAVNLVQGGKHDDRQMAELGIGLDELEGMKAVQLGHDDVEQDQVESPLLQEFERDAAVFRRRDVEA